MNTQQQIIDKQDVILDDISSEIKNLKHIAIHIGNEVDEHNVLLDDYNDDLDNTNKRLNQTNKKIDKLTILSENKHTITIVVLIIILIIMIIFYFTK
jgi:hypothetical protein